jgi:hypothetical protein
MSKRQIKERIGKSQNGICALSETVLAEDFSLIDTDRINPKANGGTYLDENTRIVDPVEHMKRHGNYREREEEIHNLKVMMDGREQMRKLVNSFNNRILAMKRGTDDLDEKTLEWLEAKLKEAKSELSKIDRRIEKYMKIYMTLPIVKKAMAIKGLGAVTIAYMLIYIDIEKARYASSLWSYTGLDKPSHKRYEKTVAGGGNKTLRTALYAMAESMIKTRSVYRDVYDAEKEKLSASEKVTNSRNTQGKMIECMWKDTKPCHRHGAAIRKMIKHFLADFWFVWRSSEGLPTAALYVQEKMGHKGIIRPEERGWEI